MLCENCGADLSNWEEVFGEPHSCPTSDQRIVKLLAKLRQNGIACFTATDLTTPELEVAIKGRG